MQLQSKFINTEETEEPLTNSSALSTNGNYNAYNEYEDRSYKNKRSDSVSKDKNSKRKSQPRLPDQADGILRKSSKSELRNDAEKTRNLKHSNSRHLLEDELDQVRSPLQMTGNTSPADNKIHRKKLTRPPSVEFKAPTASELCDKYDIQNKMDLINSLYNQLNTEGNVSDNSNLFLTTDGSVASSSKKRVQTANGGRNLSIKDRMYDESQMTLESQATVESSKHMRQPSNRFRNESSLLSMHQRNPSKYSNRDNSDDGNEVECWNHPDAFRKQQGSKKQHSAEYLNSESSYLQHKSPSRRQDATIYSRSKNWDKKAAYVEEDDEFVEEQPRKQVGKILKNRHKPPLPQESKQQSKRTIDDVDHELGEPAEEEISFHPTLTDQRDTSRDLSQQNSVLNTRRSLSGKDFISSNKADVRKNGKRLSKDYDKLLRNIDQSIKPLVKTLGLQAVGKPKSSRIARGSTPSTARKSINTEGLQSFHPSPTSKKGHQKVKNGGLERCSTENYGKDQGIGNLCETFVKTTNNFKQFQSGSLL